MTEIVELTQRQKAEWVVQQQHLSHARTRGGGGGRKCPKTLRNRVTSKQEERKLFGVR